MSIFRKITAVLCLTAVAGTGVFSYFSSSDTVKPETVLAAADDSNDDWLHAKGSKLYDMNGNQVWLTGANWFGLNCTENVPHGLYARDVDDMLSTIADHGINIIRFPISTELLMSWMEGKPQKVSSVQASYNPPVDEVGEDGTITPAGKYGNINREFVLEDGKTLKNSMEIFDIIMQKCKKYGVKALIDVHSPASHNSGHNYNLWYYEPTADDCDGMATNHLTGEPITWDNWIESITWLAEKYSKDDTILAYDLKNEPHGKREYSGDKCPANMAKWDDSTDKNNWKYSAEECAKSILSVNPNALILIEGIEQSPRFDRGSDWNTPDKFQPQPGEERWYGAWWGGNLRGVKDLPVLPESTQIMYSPHDYGKSVYAQSWFEKNFTEQTLLDDYWYDTWAYINDQDIAPLLIGEWGGHMDAGDNQKWMEILRDYMIKNHINHTFWCINPNSGDTGGLMDSSFMNWDDDKYNLFKKSLWQTDGGKFIGLDHQTALGANGMSVTEYYASGAKSNINGGLGTTQTTPVTPASPTVKPEASPSPSSPAPSSPAPSSPAPTSQAPSEIIYGDVNGDGTVDLTDLSVMAVRLVDKKSFEGDQKTRSDVDADGTVGLTDLASLRQFISKVIDRLGPKK